MDALASGSPAGAMPCGPCGPTFPM
jgi:hypothetical protein